jgi:DNA-binding response OmpR family regulator
MSSHKILVIDDSKAIGMWVRNILPLSKFEVVEAKNGLEGCDLLQRENFKLIVLDLLMPKMDGWQVYQEIQKLQKLKTIPLLFMSGRKEDLTDKIPEPFEYFAFLEKPFCKIELLNAMKEAIIKAHKYSQTLPETRSNFSATNVDFHEIALLRKKITSLEAELEQVNRHSVIGIKTK